MTCAAFDTRAAFVAWAASTPPTVGETIDAAGYSYRLIGAGSSISDAPGWAPLGNVYPDHWAQNLAPGTTNMATAINAALAYSATVYLAGCVYAVGATVAWDNAALIGCGGCGAAKTTIRGLAGMIPVGQAIIAPGRSSAVRGVQIGYDTLTGTEAQDQRVGLDTRGLSQALQRGSVIDQVRFDNVGTAISDYGSGEFSVTYGTLEIGKHSYRAVDIRGENRTGSVWLNIYINGANAYTPEGGFCSTGQCAGGFIGQLNIEHGAYRGFPIRLEGQHGLAISALNIEGVDVLTADRGYIGIDCSAVSVQSLNVLNTRMTKDGTAVVRLSGAGYQAATFSAPLTCASVTSCLRIGALHIKGLALPNNGIYPTYPANRTGVRNCPGFNVFKRDAAFADQNWRVVISDYLWALYPANVLDRARIEFPQTDFSGSIKITLAM